VVKLPSQRFQKPASCGIDLRVLPFRRVVARIKWSTGHTQYGVGPRSRPGGLEYVVAGELHAILSHSYKCATSAIVWYVQS